MKMLSSRPAGMVLCTLLVVGSLCTPLIHAQDDFARIEVFGGYSILRPNLPVTWAGGGSEGALAESLGESLLGNVLGWGAGVTVNLNDIWGITADFNGYHRSFDLAIEGESLNASARLHTFLFGPKVTMRRERVSPFVHALFGLGRIGASIKQGRDSDEFEKSGFAASIGGGVDIVAHPNISVRAIEVNYLPFRNGDGDAFTLNNIGWRSGVVFHLGR